MESNLQQSDEEFNKGWDLFQQGKYEQALEHWDQAIILQPNDNVAYINKGEALKELGQSQQAIECYNKAIELDQNYSYAWSGKGNALKELGQSQQAIECYNKAIELDQNDSLPWTNKGAALYSLGQYQQAIECYNKAIELDQNDSLPWTNKGAALYSLGQYQQAIECYNKAIELDQNFSYAWSGKGNALKELGQSQQAIECYNKAIELDQNNSYAWNGKGNALDSLGQYQQAIECYNKAIELDQNFSYAWSGKGNALKELGQSQQAIECYQKAIKLNPIDYTYFNQGLVLEKLNRNEEAMQSYKEALKLNHNNQQAQKNLSDLESKLKIKEVNKVSEIILKKQQQSTFINELSQIDQNKIAGEFLSKLSQNAAFNWVSKFVVMQSSNLKEICSYYASILPFIISKDQKDNIEIEEYNAIKAGFANIHYGIYQDDTIAIKEQLLDQNDKDAYFIQLLREIAILAFCDHPNIPKIKGIYFNPQSFKIWTIQERYYIDLFQAMKQKKKIPKKKQLIAQLLETLDYIHSIGLIHLDLKPKNILFDTQKYEKLLLIDFGISKIAKLQSTDVLGLSYGYNAPEVSIQQKSTLSPKADMFSFAIILYEFVTEKSAWKNYAGKDPKLVYQLIQGGFDFFKENDKTGNQDLDRLILDCVNKNAALRPSAKEALQRIKAIQF